MLLAYAKITLEEELLASRLPDDPDFMPELVRYFPTAAARALPRPHPHRTRCAARSSRPRS